MQKKIKNRGLILDQFGLADIAHFLLQRAEEIAMKANASNSNVNANSNDDFVSDTNEIAAAREAADQAIEQAKRVTSDAISSLKTLDSYRLCYLGSLAFIVIATLIFDMASFSVGVDYAVSETVADAQRDLQARMNSWSYPVFQSTLWGKLAWLSAASGIGLVVTGVTQKMRTAWLPLAEIACAIVCALVMILLFFVGFPDLSRYEDARCSATLLGYWLPLAASGSAVAVSVLRLK